MKICNYCGTGMDNSTARCPFCRMEMDIRGAIKYQDNRPFDGTLGEYSNRGGKTAAEVRYEEAHEDSFSSNILEKLEKSINDSQAKEAERKKTNAKVAEKERKNAAYLRNSTYDNKNSRGAQSASAQSTNAQTTSARSANAQTGAASYRETMNKSQKMSQTAVKILVVLIACAFIFPIIAVMLEMNSSYEEDYSYRDNYPTWSNFIPGEDIDGRYINKYTGIIYDYGDNYATLTEADVDDYDSEELYVSQSYDENNPDFDLYMYVSYTNKEEFAETYDSIEDYLNHETDYYITVRDNASKISDTESYLCGKQFSGVIIQHDDYYDESNKPMYQASMIAEVTDDFYATVIITSDSLEGIDKLLEGFVDEDLQ